MDQRQLLLLSALRLRLRLRLIYLGRIAEKVKYITYLGCTPARKEGSRTENWNSGKNKQRQKEMEGEIKIRKKVQIKIM